MAGEQITQSPRPQQDQHMRYEPQQPDNEIQQPDDEIQQPDDFSRGRSATEAARSEPEDQSPRRRPEEAQESRHHGSVDRATPFQKLDCYGHWASLCEFIFGIGNMCIGGCCCCEYFEYQCCPNCFTYEHHG